MTNERVSLNSSYPSLPCGEANVLDEHEQMPLVRRRWHEAKVLIERGGLLVFGMDGKCANADHVCHMQRATQRIEQQAGA